MAEYKIGIIGTEEAIAGFAGLGVIPFSMKEEADIDGHIETIKNDDFAALFITEDWAIRVREQLDKHFEREPLPAIVTVPSPQGATDAGLANLRKIVEQAVGSDILFNK